MLNPGLVNSGGFQFLLAEKSVIFCDFAGKNAIQKVR
jgi:hypothetical protein